MPARRFERIALDLMLGGCAVMFGACVLIEHAQAQPGYVPPPTPLPPPILNPSNPGTVPQPSYQPITPTTPSTAPSTPSAVPSREVRSPATEEAPSTTAYSCGYLGCVRTYSWAFPCQYYSRYCYSYGYTASALWGPGYYDHAPGH
jgi:hypothetical protein